jgi:VWFA-related protein
MILLIAAACLFAQQDATIRVDVQQVLVPVVVTDKKGHHVTGLRATDFQILEDGVPQEIAAFSSDTTASVDDIAAVSKTAPRSPGPRHTFVICVDTLHTSAADFARMRQTLETLFEKEKPADAQYALIGIGRQLQVLQAATANPLEILLKIRGPAFQNLMGGLDASALSAEIQNIRSHMDEFCKRCACGTRSSQRNCDSEIDTLKQSVDSDAERWVAPVNGLMEQFRAVVEELAKLPTSRTLILVSDGFSMDPKREFYGAVSAYLPNRPQFRMEDSKSLKPGLEDALRIAYARNVTIFAIDSRGAAPSPVATAGSMDASATGASAGGVSMLGTNRNARQSGSVLRGGVLETNPSAPEDSITMQQLAHATGGVYFHDTGDMLKQFRSALADGREYYLLAYVPKNTSQDGKFRTITVETKDKKLNIRSKSGYWAAGAAQ